MVYIEEFELSADFEVVLWNLTIGIKMVGGKLGRAVLETEFV